MLGRNNRTSVRGIIKAIVRPHLTHRRRYRLHNLGVDALMDGDTRRRGTTLPLVEISPFESVAHHQLKNCILKDDGGVLSAQREESRNDISLQRLRRPWIRPLLILLMRLFSLAGRFQGLRHFRTRKWELLKLHQA